MLIALVGCLSAKEHHMINEYIQEYTRLLLVEPPCKEWLCCPCSTSVSLAQMTGMRHMLQYQTNPFCGIFNFDHPGEERKNHLQKEKHIFPGHGTSPHEIGQS